MQLRGVRQECSRMSLPNASSAPRPIRPFPKEERANGGEGLCSDAGAVCSYLVLGQHVNARHFRMPPELLVQIDLFTKTKKMI